MPHCATAYAQFVESGGGKYFPIDQPGYSRKFPQGESRAIVIKDGSRPLMDVTFLCMLLVCISCIALLYSSIGHGGASGYIFIMLVLGFAPEVIRPTVLLANIMVSSVAAVQFYRAGLFHWSIFWKFAIASVPFAYLGGSLVLPVENFKLIAGIVLCFSALRIMIGRTERFKTAIRVPPAIIAISAGAGIGFLSGLIGIGGGVFLSPLLILAGWAGIRETSSIAALFVLVNSISGFLGQLNSFYSIQPVSALIVATALFAGFAGSTLGSRRLPLELLKKALSLVLFAASCKLIFF